MRVLVTGAAGFVGRHLVDALVAAGHEVLPLVRPGRSPTWRVEVAPLELDLASPALAAGLPEGVDALVHLAQSGRYREPDGADDVFAVNVASTHRLAAWAGGVGVRRLVLTSTGGVYGPGALAAREEDPAGVEATGPGPLALYFASKRAAEELALAAGPDVHVAVLRPFFVYGRGQLPSMLVPRLVRRVLSGAPITLAGPEGLALNPVHVSDLVRALDGALALDGAHVVNVAGPEVLTLRAVGEAIGGALGRPPRFEVGPGTGADRLVGDTTRMAALLGPPGVRFSDGVREVCEEALVEAG